MIESEDSSGTARLREELAKYREQHTELVKCFDILNEKSKREKIESFEDLEKSKKKKQKQFLSFTTSDSYSNDCERKFEYDEIGLHYYIVFNKFDKLDPEEQEEVKNQIKSEIKNIVLKIVEHIYFVSAKNSKMFDA
ncbi:unnamed protein product [Rotaria sp. Silwood1]|nr:unnamed protein product [Rotaria sp. Silwood1]